MTAAGFDEETLRTADGATIAARIFAPDDAPRAGVLIVPAMGVVQPYYAAFASWLARRGMFVLTFDFRGMGLSRTGSLRGLRADIMDWARYDCAAALDALAARVPDRSLYWIGHSLGGQIIPFVPNRERVTKFITIGTGSGYWRENADPIRRRVWFLWFVLVPLLVPLFGYFPGRRLGIVGDLPAGVMRQWRRWCLHPEYAAGVEGEAARALYASVRTPIVSISFTDDEFMSARNTESMHGFYTNAPRKMIRLAPADIGVSRIGHFGFFRPDFADTLWQRWLLPELDGAQIPDSASTAQDCGQPA